MDSLIDSMLGKDYLALEPIGFGGMAVVYLVEHQTLRKRFAAKVLSVELAANLEARARFTQEAHAASQLDHENIVNISDFGVTADQRPFFVMELLRGQTLDQRVADGPMSLEEVVAVAVPVARALAHAHAEGIIHRDVKPENVFLVQRSQSRFGVKVVDFGIAKTPLNTRLTKMGETLGSPMFMSPEACRGEDVDHRADLYSFGVLLYLMLCGRVPFEDASLLRVLQMQVSTPLPPPGSINPELSPELTAVIERALAKDPDDRYVSMEALLIDLEAAVPPGSDRLLIETQTGGASSFRTTTFAGQPSGPRVDSQRMSKVPSQPTLGAARTPAPSADTLTVVSVRRSRAWLAALPVLAVVAVGGFFALDRDATHAPDASSLSPSPSPSIAQPEPRGAQPPPAGASEPPPAAATVRAAPARDAPAAPTVATIHLHLTTTPGGARVELDGKLLGNTPLDADVAKADGDGKLVVSRDGFSDVKQRLDLRSDRSMALALTPIARPPRVTRRPPPPPRRPAAPAAPAVPVVEDAHPATPAAGSAAPKGDPNLDIRLSR